MILLLEARPLMGQDSGGSLVHYAASHSPRAVLIFIKPKNCCKSVELYLYLTGPAAMLRLVRPWPYRFLREKKWRRLNFDLCVHYRMPLQAVHCSLGCVNYGKVFFKSSSIQSSNDRIKAVSIFYGDT